MEETDNQSRSPLFVSCREGHLEEGSNRDKVSNCGHTPLHLAAYNRHLEKAKLLIVYGADLNTRNKLNGDLPIDMADNEKIAQAIRDEPRRRMDEAPGKRATEQDRHPNSASSASAQQVDAVQEEQEPISKKSRLDQGEAEEEGNIADEDQDSEPSDGEDDS